MARAKMTVSVFIKLLLAINLTYPKYAFCLKYLDRGCNEFKIKSKY